MKRSQRALPFEIIHEDGDLIVINKPAGLLAVPIRNSQAANLLSLLQRFLSAKKQRAHVVHRIDRYTSGLVVYAKHPRARDRLVRQFLNHTPEREYLAVVAGTLSTRRGWLTHHLRLTKDGFRQQVVAKGGKDSAEARLQYRVISQGRESALVAVRLETGLKNQIRVQFAEIGHPIIGDRHYASEQRESELDHQALHAGYLRFQHPKTGRAMSFEAPLPRDLADLIAKHDLVIQEKFPYFPSGRQSEPRGAI